MGHVSDNRLRAGTAFAAGFMLAIAVAADVKADEGTGEDAFAAWAVVPESELADHRGGAVTITNSGDQVLTFTGNAVDVAGVIDSPITISGSAFGNLNGFQAIVLNSGNNSAVSLRYTVNFIIQ